MYKRFPPLCFSKINTIFIYTAVNNMQADVFSVICYKGIKGEFFIMGIFVNKFIFRLRSFQFVKIYTMMFGFIFFCHCSWFRITAVIKTASVMTPCHSSKSHPFYHFFIVFAGIDISDFYFLSVASMKGKTVSH